MSKRKKNQKPKVEKKPKGPKLEGRKIKQIDLVRLRELRVELQQIKQDEHTNLKMGAFILRTYVKEGETMAKMDLDKGAVVVQLVPED